MTHFLMILFVILFLAAPSAKAREPGEVFRDCPDCPEMVVVPAGDFAMGDDAGQRDQRPSHKVTFPRHFAMATTITTFDQWNQCVIAAVCTDRPDDHGWGRGTRPVINVSWNDVQVYTAWLSKKTGAVYRLPSEAEFEYAAKAGTTTLYWWGDDIGDNHANCRHCTGATISDRSTPVDAFPANPFGLHDMNGNVWEWVLDCWVPSHVGAPADGSARDQKDCAYRVSKGGAWYYEPRLSRPSARVRQHNSMWSYTVGFRVVRDLIGESEDARGMRPLALPRN